MAATEAPVAAAAAELAPAAASSHTVPPTFATLHDNSSLEADDDDEWRIVLSRASSTEQQKLQDAAAATLWVGGQSEKPPLTPKQSKLARVRWRSAIRRTTRARRLLRRVVVAAAATRRKWKERVSNGLRKTTIPGKRRKSPPQRDLSVFVGTWAIVEERGKGEYLKALDLNWIVRKAAASMATPSIAFSVDATGQTLHSSQGPIFGRMITSKHPPGVTTSEEAFQGVTTCVTSKWEDEAQAGPREVKAGALLPVLYCRTTSEGKPGVCDQRSRVELDAKGKPARLLVETRLTKTPGSPAVEYDRVYELQLAK